MTTASPDPGRPTAQFTGRIGNVMGASEPAWPSRPRASGKPNVIVVLLDDVGFSDLGCYGGEIDTPNIDRLASDGVQFTNFHVNPMCSPTRASLLTGLNCHNVGFGHVANSDPGFPGYFSELPDDVSTIAETLRAQGYATLLAGKWHLARDADISAVGPKHSWPCQRGFDRFFGFLDAFTNVHHPHYLVEDNHVVDIDEYPPGYYLTDDLTTKSIQMIKEVKATDPATPFFLYLAHPAAHAPLLAKPETIAKYKDRFSAGWDALRDQRFDRQKELGLFADNTALPPRNTEQVGPVPAWADVADEHRALFTKQMEVYAAMVDDVDQSIGRLRSELEAIGEWNNTIVVFLSDNGASREGEGVGTTSYYNDLAGGSGPSRTEPLSGDLDPARIAAIGGPTVMAHYPRGWAMLGNTPFRLYKTFALAGGHQVPCIVTGPGIPGDGSLRTQYQHVIDLAPTLLDLVDVTPATQRHGRDVRPMQGTSFAGVLRAPEASSTRDEQHYELGGQRAFWRNGWEIATVHLPRTPFNDDEWQLFHVAQDPTQQHDLRAEHPELLAELAGAWEHAARMGQVYPLDEGSGWRWAVRPPDIANIERAITLWPGTATVEPWRSRRLIWMKSFEISASFTTKSGDHGVLVAHGDQGGGYLLYVEDGRVRFAVNDGRGTLHNLEGPELPSGEQQVTVAVSALAGRRWSISLRLGGRSAGDVLEVPMLFPMAPFEGIDVGIDRRSPVSWDIYERHGTFAFTGTIHHVRYEPGAKAPDAPSTFLPLMRDIASQFA